MEGDGRVGGGGREGGAHKFLMCVLRKCRKRVDSKKKGTIGRQREASFRRNERQRTVIKGGGNERSIGFMRSQGQQGEVVGQ